MLSDVDLVELDGCELVTQLLNIRRDRLALIVQWGKESDYNGLSRMLDVPLILLVPRQHLVKLNYDALKRGSQRTL